MLSINISAFILFLIGLSVGLPAFNNGTNAEIEVLIKDHKGVDVTSAFQIMIYPEPTALDNDSDIGRRTLVSRTINDCQIATAKFQSSRCTPKDGKPLGMQSWRIHCHLPYNVSHPESQEFTKTVWVPASRDGHCEEDEVCVDSHGANAFGWRANVAKCVSHEDYVLVNSSSLDSRPRFKIPLGSKRVRMGVSKSDGRTSLEVDAFGVKAQALSDVVQESSCRDCMKLQSDVLRPDIQSLRTETTLLTTGVLAGILWLTVISG